jgi:hypothetical protein
MPLGLTVDIPVTAATKPGAFYETLLGRGPDLHTDGVVTEWILARAPELAIRLVYRERVLEPVRVGIAVADLNQERTCLEHVPDIPQIEVKPGIIATLTLTDPDGNQVVLWQDLLNR